jgi:hypothetical protein
MEPTTPKAGRWRFRVTKTMAAWSEYQEEVAQLFRDLGLSAETNATLEGARTSHQVDVLVRSKLAGIKMTWLVECKQWKAAVPKEKVAALRTIVNDTGADRGFIMAESGYQAGALEAARLTNISLTSLRDLKETAAYELGTIKLESLWVRCDSCRTRYWAISKQDRIEVGLRPDVGGSGYSGKMVIEAVESAMQFVRFRGYPITYDRLWSALNFAAGSRDVAPEDVKGILCETPAELFDVLDAELRELEALLDAGEATLRRQN